MGNTAVEWYLKFHGGIDADEKGTARRNNGGGDDCNHWIRDRRVPAEWLRRRHHWGSSEGRSLPGTHVDRTGRDALESRDQGAVPGRQDPETREEHGVPGSVEKRPVSRSPEQRGVPRSEQQRPVSRSAEGR